MLEGVRKEIIGNCTLYCADSVGAVAALDRLESVVTDPPYGMSYIAKAEKWKSTKIRNDGNTSCLNWACRLQPNHSAYVFCRWDNLVQIPQPRSLVTWLKNNHGPGDCAHSHGRTTEVVAFYPGPNHSFPDGRPRDVVRCAKTLNEHHPTEKPVELMRVLVSWTVGTVVDPFMGSGSTGVACAKLGRSFVGFEIDEAYFETACHRVEEAYKQREFFAG